jgi:dolichol-phosphate mannosyltransferase
LQHDETILPKMYALLEAGAGDLAIGTRVRDGTEVGLSPMRQKLSDLGRWVFDRIAGQRITDPMSGYFMIRREIVSRLAPRLSPDGFKILVDVILSAVGTFKVIEVPYRFRERTAGESKLTALVGLDFLGLVAHHISRGLLPVRFVLFALIGLIGLFVHILVLAGCRAFVGGWSFETAQIVATIVAMGSNFLLNNEITYRNQRYRGVGMVGGFVAFAVACGVGALANINVAAWLYSAHQTWWLSGISGALLSVVWNYAVSTSLIWRPRRRG